MKDLIERLEKATGADGELNAYIWLAVDRPNASRCFWNGTPGLPKPIPERLPLGLGRNAVIACAPQYTGSFDEALMLIPDGLYWLASEGKTRPDEPLGAAQILEPITNAIVGEAEHASVVVALCIAALKARLALSTSDGDK